MAIRVPAVLAGTSTLLFAACMAYAHAQGQVTEKYTDPVTGKSANITRSTAPYREFRYGTLKVFNVVDFTTGATQATTYRHFDIQTYRETGFARLATSAEYAAALKTGEASPREDSGCTEPNSVGSRDKADGSSSALNNTDEYCDDGGDVDPGDGGSDPGTGAGGNDPGGDPPPTVSNPNPGDFPQPPPSPTQLGTVNVAASTSTVTTTQIFESDGYNWSITWTWTRSVTNLGNGNYSDGSWSAAIPSPVKKLGPVTPPPGSGGKPCPTCKVR